MSKRKQLSCKICFLISAFVWCYISFFEYGRLSVMDSMNCEVYLFNYSYGFIPRAVMGSLYSIFFKDYTIDNILIFSLVIHIICALIIIGCIHLLFKKCEQFRGKNMCEYCLSLLLVSAFSNRANFGRNDEILLTLSLLAIMLIVYEKFEWVAIPISALGVCVHEGYVFLYVNVILVLFLYKAYTRKSIKYLIYCITTLVFVSILFLYFMKIGNINEIAFNDISQKSLALMGKGYYEEFLRAELLGEDLFLHELSYRPYCFTELGFFIILSFPIVEILYTYIKKIFKNKTIVCFIFLSGLITLIPEYLLRLDFGRWTIALIFYLATMTIAFILLGEIDIKKALNTTLELISQKRMNWCILSFSLVCVLMAQRMTILSSLFNRIIANAP